MYKDGIRLVENFRTNKVSGFVLLKRLRSGGFGEVWEAIEEATKRLVAIKFIERSGHTQSDMLFRREQHFLTKIETTIRTKYPSMSLPVPLYYHTGEIHPETNNANSSNRTIDYFVQELLCGADLGQRLTEIGNRCMGLKVEYLRSAFEALSFIHRCGIIHCDIKPENIKISHGEAKFMDLGLAIDIAPASRSLERGLGYGGTWLYSAPEQITRETCEERSDIFSLGIIMHHALAGFHPFLGASTENMIPKTHEQIPAYLLFVKKCADKLNVKLGENEKLRKLATLTRECLQPAATNRPSATEAASHLISLNQYFDYWPPPIDIFSDPPNKGTEPQTLPATYYPSFSQNTINYLNTPGQKMAVKPLRVFYSYSHADEGYRDELAKHLRPLERERMLETWHDRAIEPGVEWDTAIRRKLQEADIILLLVSSDFLASDYIWSKELTPALERHETGLARVIPVILRSCEWNSAPFSKLQALPKNAVAISSWPDRDAAYANITTALRKLAAR